MKSAMLAQKDLQGFLTERMQLLQGTKENNKFHPVKGSLIFPPPLQRKSLKEMRHCGQTMQVGDREA